MFEQNALSAAVTFPKGVDDIEIAKILSDSAHQSGTFKPLKPANLSESTKKLFGFRLYPVEVAEVGTTFGDVYCADLTCPVVKIFEEMLMNTLQVSEIIRGEFEINFTGSDY